MLELQLLEQLLLGESSLPEASLSRPLVIPSEACLCAHTGVPGCLHRDRDTGRGGRVQLPGLQTQGGVCHEEADTVSLSAGACSAPQEVQLQQRQSWNVQSLLSYV